MRPQPVLMEAETATGHTARERVRTRGRLRTRLRPGLQSWGWGWVRARRRAPTSKSHLQRAGRVCYDWLCPVSSASTIIEDTRPLTVTSPPALGVPLSASIRSLNWVRGSQPIRERRWVIQTTMGIGEEVITLENKTSYRHAMQFYFTIYSNQNIELRFSTKSISTSKSISACMFDS